MRHQHSIQDPEARVRRGRGRRHHHLHEAADTDGHGYRGGRAGRGGRGRGGPSVVIYARPYCCYWPTSQRTATNVVGPQQG
jgi:hypothetical protein